MFSWKWRPQSLEQATEVRQLFSLFCVGSFLTLSVVMLEVGLPIRLVLTLRLRYPVGLQYLGRLLNLSSIIFLFDLCETRWNCLGWGICPHLSSQCYPVVASCAVCITLARTTDASPTYKYYPVWSNRQFGCWACRCQLAFRFCVTDATGTSAV